MSSSDRVSAPTARDRVLLETFLRGAWRRRWTFRGAPFTVLVLLMLLLFAGQLDPMGLEIWVAVSVGTVGWLVFQGLRDWVRGPHFGPDEQLDSASIEVRPDPEAVRELADRYRSRLQGRSGSRLEINGKVAIPLSEEILESSHAFAALGPRAIPPLLDLLAGMSREKASTKSEMVEDLIRAIVAGTMERFHPDPGRFLCGRCLVGLAQRPLPLKTRRLVGRMRSATSEGYVTCPRCQDLVDVVPRGDGLVAVLDASWTGPERWREGEFLCLDWFRLRQPVDADAIRIVRAEDRDVEHFLIQLSERAGADEPKPIPWTATCDLDPNTVTMLERRVGPASPGVGPRP